MIPPTRLDDEVLERSSRGCAIPTSAAATSARSSPRTASPSGASASSARGAGATPSSPRWTSSTRTRSGWCAPRSRRFPTGGTRPRRARGASTASSRSAAAVDGRGRRVEIDFAGTSPQHDGNLNCPLAVDALGVLLRRPLPDRPGPARVGRSVRARDRDRAGGLSRQRASARGRRRRQRRDLVAGSSTSSSPRSARRSTCPPRARGR